MWILNVYMCQGVRMCVYTFKYCICELCGLVYMYMSVWSWMTIPLLLTDCSQLIMVMQHNVCDKVIWNPQC